MRQDDARSAAALFDRSRLTLARQLAGKRKVDLARDLDVTPGAITQYENGQSKPSPATLAKLALVLGMTPSFFVRDARPLANAHPSRAFFRSLRATRQIEREAAEAYATLAWETAAALERRVRLPAVTIPMLPMRSSVTEDAIESAAMEVRAVWNVPDGPVAHVVRLLEAHGVVIARRMAGHTRVDAFSQWIGQRPVVVLSVDKRDAARSRFDAAHELGHLVMHPDPEAGNALLERQAHAFAASFLMPREIVLPYLPSRVDWDALQALKETWGVSMAAILFRARSLGTMTDGTYRRAMSLMSKWGWRREEPGGLKEAEEPALLASALSLATQTGFGEAALSQELALPIRLLREILAVDTRPTLHVVSEQAAIPRPLGEAWQG